MSRARPEPPKLRLKRLPRRRDGLHQPATIREEAEQLKKYVNSQAPDRRLQLMAYGAFRALEWALNNRDDMKMSRMLDLTAFALRFKRKTPLRIVPQLVRKKCGDVYDDGDHRYRCTLEAGHGGEHVMTTNPLHPSWR